MAKLQDLPTEVLSQIFRHLLSRPQTLRGLAVQCQYISRVIRPIIFEHLRLDFRKHLEIHTLQLLDRSITGYPELIPMIRSISVTWTDGNGRNDAEVKGALYTLLGRLKALRGLEIHNSTDRTFRHRYLEDNELHSLSNVTINDTALDIRDLTKYLFLKNISQVRVLWLSNPLPRIFFTETQARAKWSLNRPGGGKCAGQSSVVDLNLGAIVHLPENVLTEVLSWPKTLRRLRCTLPGSEIVGRLGATKQLLTTLSPNSIARMLSPTKDTLQDLELIDEGCDWPGHDNTKMDLSTFNALSKMFIPSTCFFKNLTYGDKRRGLYLLLPPELIELRILFDLKDCIRPRPDELGPLHEQASTFEDFIDLELLNLGIPNDLQWLMEIAQNKKSCYPKLRQVQLIERCGTLRNGVFPANWPLPEMIAAEFDREGIEFRAVMRMKSQVPTFD